MARSCAQLINETQGLLQSFSLDESQSTTLSANIGTTDSTFVVTSTRGIATGLSPGVIEIDQELMYCDSVDGTGNATVPAWGRGYLGTPKSAHLAGARVISQPTFPRFWTLQAINETIDRVYPEIFVPKSYETTTTVPKFTYDLPADARWVLRAAWQEPGPAQYWRTVRRFRMSPGGGTQIGDTNKSVDVGDWVVPGRPIQFIYAAPPLPLVNETDDFAGATGMSTGMIDVICFGAASGLLTVSQELSRLQMSSVEQQNRSQLVAPSAALTSSRYLDQKFNERLAEERISLQRLYPPRITGVWA